ncbi:MAG: MalY/PatB family protein [Athalassotoga sp.]|uniref:MalY/PatB family protein n=1 Tax=Athalassotoga sp. TaxID=2022597 RepID=UPI003D013043
MERKHYNFDEIIDRHGTNSVKWEGMTKMFRREGLFPMWVADMDFKVPQEIIDAIKMRAEQGIFGYTFRSENFYNSIIGWMARRHDLDIKREWIVDGAGVVSALTIAVLAYTKPGDEIIVQPPVYYPFFRIIKNNGRIIVNNPLKFENKRYSMDFEDLRKKITNRTKMVILCNPHNPVGRVWNRQEIGELLNICDKNDLILASDEIHSDFVYEPNKHTSVLSFASKANTVTFLAPNKTFNLAGIPSSIVVIPDKRLRDEFEVTLENLDVETSNIFSIVATQAAYTYGDEWFDALLEYLTGNLKFLESFLDREMPKVDLVKPEGTYLAWLDFRRFGLSDENLSSLIIKKAHLALDDGNLFGIGGSGFQRMNIAMPRELLLTGLEKLKNALGDVENA